MSETSVSSKDQFDRQAKHYDAEWNSWSKDTLDWLLAQAKPNSADLVLDIATGAGFTALAFAPLVAHVAGTDVSTGMLEQAKKNAAGAGITNVEFVEGAAEELPFDNASYDIAVCRIAAHHFIDIRDFAEEAARILKPGGKLLIVDTSVPDNDFLAAIWQNEIERLRDPSHGKNYTANEWRKILTRASFDIVSITDSGGGIRIPLTSWIRKAGCSEEVEEVVRRKFAEAPTNVRTKYLIDMTDDGETWFTWQRVLISAVKRG